MINASEIPAELTATDQWVTWRIENRDGKPTKVPYCPRTAQRASCNDPMTWVSFDEALAAEHLYDGLGFQLTREAGITGVDLDHCRDAGTGKVTEWAKAIIIYVNSYTEVSPSGTGFRILTRGALPEGGRKRGDFEVYDSARFVTITGNHLSGTPGEILDRQAEIDALHGWVFAPRPAVNRKKPTTPSVGLSDDDVIAKAFAAKNGPKFRALWSGDTSAYPSPSEADLALISVLRFWTGGDREQLDRLYRRSGLMRPKWDEQHGVQTYGDMTIDKALEGVDVMYTKCFPRTDAGNAELFAHLYCDRVRFDHRRRRWLIWEDHHWNVDSDAEVVRLAKAAARHRLRAAADIVDSDASKAEAKWAVASENRVRIDAMLALAEAEPPLANVGDGWDGDPWLLGVKNGVIDLKTGLLRDGWPEDGITMYVDIEYNPNAECPRFEKFLTEVFEGKVEVIDFVQRAVGYSLTGDTSEQCLFACWGTGSNGKSVLLKTLRLLTGGYGHNMPFSTLDFQNRNAVPSDVADLAGRRLVTASETAESTRLNEDRIKALTGGDPVTARHLYGRWFTFQPEFKLWLAVNHKPRVKDDSHGFWRRVRLIPFTRRFSAEEIDKHLDAKLAAEAPGILAWAVRGCLNYQREGLEPPEVITQATKEYREEQDPLAEFIRMRCDVGEGLVVRAGELYEAYVTWAMLQLVSPREQLTSTRFGTLIGERFHGERDEKGKFYKGVALRVEEVRPFSLSG